MPPSLFEVAVRNVVTAIATTSHLAKIINWDPLVFKPDNLLDLTLGGIGINTPELIATFKEILTELLPETATNIQELNLNPNVKIRPIANHVESLIGLKE